MNEKGKERELTYRRFQEVRVFLEPFGKVDG
jgi:hypothetical protein